MDKIVLLSKTKIPPPPPKDIKLMLCKESMQSATHLLLVDLPINTIDGAVSTSCTCCLL